MEKSLYSLCIILLATCCLCAPTSRKVTFVNNCGDDYYINPVSGAAPYASPSLSSCNSDADCSPGSSCLLPNTHICFYDVPTPETGVFVVSAGKTNSITFPFYSNNDPAQWTGNFAFCGSESSCDLPAAICEQQGCGVAAGPYNQIEINFSKQDVDFYDISNIGGMNVPMMVTPDVTNPSFMAGDPYRCGHPGSPNPITALGASLWNPVVSSPYYQWVLPGDQFCAQNSDCPANEVCGLSNQPGATPQWQLNCGKLQGHWTANAACAQDPNNLLNVAPFTCGANLNNGGISTTFGALQGCNGATGSGYSVGADTRVCGCQNWDEIFGTEVVSTQTQNCTNWNPLWKQEILPTLTWIKQICPSCYVYPYDDQSSTFVCELIENGYNAENYTITLCPTSPSITTPAPTQAPTQAPTHAATSAPTATAVPTTQSAQGAAPATSPAVPTTPATIPTAPCAPVTTLPPCAA